MSEVDVIIGKNLRTLRQSQGLTQKDLARLLDVTFQQVQKYEEGVNRLSAANLWKLCVSFQVRPEAFFDGCGEPVSHWENGDPSRENRRLLKHYWGAPPELREAVIVLLASLGSKKLK